MLSGSLEREACAEVVFPKLVRPRINWNTHLKCRFLDFSPGDIDSVNLGRGQGMSLSLFLFNNLRKY